MGAQPWSLIPCPSCAGDSAGLQLSHACAWLGILLIQAPTCKLTSWLDLGPVSSLGDLGSWLDLVTICVCPEHIVLKLISIRHLSQAKIWLITQCWQDVGERRVWRNRNK